MDDELDLMAIAHELWRKKLWIILAFVAGSIAAYIISAFLLAPRYTASLSMYVYNDPEKKTETYDDLNMSVKLVDTYITILKSNTVLREVMSETHLHYTETEMSNMISATQVNNTEVFKINVTAPSPKDAYLIANTLSKVAPKEILRVVKAGSIETVDFPEKNPPKTFPVITKNVAIGGLLGFLLASSVVLILHLLDKTLKQKDELSNTFGYNVFGSIPSFYERVFLLKKNLELKKIKLKGKDSSGVSYVEKKEFAVTEAYKALRTNVNFSVVKEEKKIISITSPSAGEGKTTTCVNLAISFALTGAKVLLIDADLRKPNVCKTLNITAEKGLTNVLTKQCTIGEAIITSEYRNLDILPSGIPVSFPAEILATDEMSDLLSLMGSQYDYVFVDTPPVNTVTDVAVLSKSVTGTLLLIRQAITTFQDVRNAIERLKLVNGNILGFIFNDVDGKRGGYGNYSGNYNYSYYYGHVHNNERGETEEAEVKEKYS